MHVYASITTINGDVLVGPWRLRNMFDIVSCPVFERDNGNIVPMSFVSYATKSH